MVGLKWSTIIQIVSSCKSTDQKNDEDIKLKECSAYEKPPDIELEECPAYVEKNKDQDIELEECPAYGHLRAVIIIVTGQCTEFNHIIWNRIKAY